LIDPLHRVGFFASRLAPTEIVILRERACLRLGLAELRSQFA
jgi:hypothetical protein